MITVFTICSTNYLAHAKTLGDSLRRHNPDYHFVIGLADRVPEKLHDSFWHPYELIPVEDLRIDGFTDMVGRYDVVEINTAVKPFLIEHLYQRDPSVQAVIYLDPDTVVYAPMNELVERLGTHNLIVTPHSCTYDESDTVIYYEKGMLCSGIYNLGFIATGRSDVTSRFLRWWQRRLREHCYYAPGTGVFVDQLWVTLAPLYFDVYVEKAPGYNMCYWNHFERRLSSRDGRYMVNDRHELVFYHFSSYNPDKPDSVTARVKARTQPFSERPDLRPIYDEYRGRLLANGYETVKSVKYSLRKNPTRPPVSARAAALRWARGALLTLPSRAQWLLQRGAQFTLNTFK